MSSALRILDEDRIELEGVCDLLKCSMATAYRACRRGLEHLHTGPRRGGKIITSRQAVVRYLAKLNGIDLDATEAVEATPAVPGGDRPNWTASIASWTPPDTADSPPSPRVRGAGRMPRKARPGSRWDQDAQPGHTTTEHAC